MHLTRDGMFSIEDRFIRIPFEVAVSKGNGSETRRKNDRSGSTVPDLRVSSFLVAQKFYLTAQQAIGAGTKTNSNPFRKLADVWVPFGSPVAIAFFHELCPPTPSNSD